MTDGEFEQSINVRCTKDTRKMLLNLSRKLDLTQSEVIEKALRLLDAQEKSKQN